MNNKPVFDYPLFAMALAGVVCWPSIIRRNARWFLRPTRDGVAG